MKFDESRREVTFKVIYYGPALSGKTTNLLKVHDHLPREQRGDLVTLDTHNDRTLFFDLLPFFLIAPSGLRLKLKAYTVPGQVRYDSTRKAVLSGADGIVFVADSQLNQQFNNAQSLATLESNCKALGMGLDKLPMVVQFNKRDLPDVLSEKEVHERWGQTGIPVLFASAINDVNALETFVKVCRLVYAYCDEEMHLDKEHGLPEEAFLKNLGAPV